MNREEFKLACLAILDGVASEHPAGHQGKLAARYLLRTGGGAAIELLFEKGPNTPPNLWLSGSTSTTASWTGSTTGIRRPRRSIRPSMPPADPATVDILR